MIHQDAKYSILIILTIIAISGALVSLCFTTFGGIFFSGVFVITLLFLIVSYSAVIR